MVSPEQAMSGPIQFAMSNFCAFRIELFRRAESGIVGFGKVKISATAPDYIQAAI